jgi:hypothetical protein
VEAQSHGSKVVEKHNHDRQAAEDHAFVFPSAGLVKHQARFIFFELYQVNRTDKGKSVRKAEAQNHGSKAAIHAAMIARSPKTSYRDQKRFL